MITRVRGNVEQCEHGAYRPCEIYGLSTDTKPTDVENGSTFYEMDTKMLYMFDEENKRWIAQ